MTTFGRRAASSCAVRISIISRGCALPNIFEGMPLPRDDSMKKAAAPTAPAINTPPIAPPTTSGRAPVEPLLILAPLPIVGVAVIDVVGLGDLDDVVEGEEPKDGELEGVNAAEGELEGVNVADGVVVGEEPGDGEFDEVEEIVGEDVIGIYAAPAGAV